MYSAVSQAYPNFIKFLKELSISLERYHHFGVLATSAYWVIGGNGLKRVREGVYIYIYNELVPKDQAALVRQSV